MRETIKLAQERRVAVGAHPGFADLLGFGRRRLPVTPHELENVIAYQIGALMAVATLEATEVTHVKTHGALGNMCAENDDLAMAVGRAIRAVDRRLRFMVMPGQATARAADRLGLPVINEIYADRTYSDDFNLTPRGVPGAVRENAEEIVSAVSRMMEEGAIFSTSGRKLPAKIQSICIHGDTPGALATAIEVRRSLEKAGYSIGAHYR
jgi:UPF0271 protein